MFVYDQLDKAVRDGARYLSFFDPNDPRNYPIARRKEPDAVWLGVGQRANHRTGS